MCCSVTCTICCISITYLPSDENQLAARVHVHTLQHTAAHCNTLHNTAAHCNTLQHSRRHDVTGPTATHCITLQHTATHCVMPHVCEEAIHCNTLHYTALQCTTLQHTASCHMYVKEPFSFEQQGVAVCCSVLQCAAVFCSVLQCVAVCTVK